MIILISTYTKNSIIYIFVYTLVELPRPRPSLSDVVSVLRESFRYGSMGARPRISAHKSNPPKLINCSKKFQNIMGQWRHGARHNISFLFLRLRQGMIQNFCQNIQSDLDSKISLIIGHAVYPIKTVTHLPELF